MPGRRTPFLLAFLVGAFAAMQIHADDSQYELGTDSQIQDGVPQGKVTEYVWSESRIFPGTIRRYWVYVPAQYDGSEPASVMVFQDGHTYVDPKGQFRATVVMDNLIHKQEMPVTVGIFIDPGHTTDELPEKPGWQPRPANRSVEYDKLSDDYARFLLEEILPEVSKSVSLTDDPDQRAICGISSGGICAFTVAWEHPEAFRKVLSHVGSFTNIRGGHVYPALIREEDRKPIRIFLQDGKEDLDNRFGNWPLANQQMAKALEFKEYDFEFVFGEGGHNGIHGGAILPESMRWLWRTEE